MNSPLNEKTIIDLSTSNHIILNIISVIFLIIVLYGIFIDLKFLFLFSSIKNTLSSKHKNKNGKTLILLSCLVAISYLLMKNLLLLFYKNSQPSLPSQLLLNLLFQIYTLFLIYIIDPFKTVKSKLNKITKKIMIIFKAYAGFLPLMIIAAFLSNYIARVFNFHLSGLAAVEMIKNIKEPKLLVIIGFEALIMAPIVEELFFRRTLQRLLRTKLSFLPSAIIISVIFSLLHLSSFAFLPIFILSLILCYLYEKSKNILIPILLHALNNWISFFLIMIYKAYFKNL